MYMKRSQSADQRAISLIDRDAISFSLEPIFPADGQVESKLVMRLPIGMQISCYAFQTEFLLGAYSISKALQLWSNIPRDALGMAPKIYIPVSLRVLADYRFLEVVTQSDRLLENASWFVLMGTPDSSNLFPDTLDIHGLADAYKAIGVHISMGEIQARHIHMSMIQDGIESVLPSVKFERTPSEQESLEELKQLASRMGIPFLTNQRTPWILTLPEFRTHACAT
jgi:hypothetical protein